MEVVEDIFSWENVNVKGRQCPIPINNKDLMKRTAE